MVQILLIWPPSIRSSEWQVLYRSQVRYGVPQGSVLVSGFCHFGLVLFMVLWQSPDTPVMSGCSCERAASSVLESGALVCIHCFVWSVVFGSRHSCLEFRFVSGFRHSRSIFCHCVSARSRVRSRPHTLVHVCFVVLHAVHVSIGYMHLCYILCCVARSLYIHWLRAFMLSCVNTWLMSFLISCVFMSCFAHGWWFVCWPCACVFVLCEHVASVLVFCVPRALMSICLDPTHLVTCLLINFPQLFSIVTLLICSLYNLLVFAVPCGFVTLC